MSRDSQVLLQRLFSDNFTVDVLFIFVQVHHHDVNVSRGSVCGLFTLDPLDQRKARRIATSMRVCFVVVLFLPLLSRTWKISTLASLHMNVLKTFLSFSFRFKTPQDMCIKNFMFLSAVMSAYYNFENTSKKEW